jgi:hypothetical protein
MTSHKAWGEVGLMTRCTTCICANTMRGEISRPTYDWLQTQALNPCKVTLSYCYHGKKCLLLPVQYHHRAQNISQMTVPFSANKLSKDYNLLMYNPFEYTSVSVRICSQQQWRGEAIYHVQAFLVCVKIKNQHDNEFNLCRAMES